MESIIFAETEDTTQGNYFWGPKEMIYLLYQENIRQ